MNPQPPLPWLKTKAALLPELPTWTVSPEGCTPQDCQNPMRGKLAMWQCGNLELRRTVRPPRPIPDCRWWSKLLTISALLTLPNLKRQGFGDPDGSRKRFGSTILRIFHYWNWSKMACTSRHGLAERMARLCGKTGRILRRKCALVSHIVRWVELKAEVQGFRTQAGLGWRQGRDNG